MFLMIYSCYYADCNINSVCEFRVPIIFISLSHAILYVCVVSFAFLLFYNLNIVLIFLSRERYPSQVKNMHFFDEMNLWRCCVRT